MKESLIRDKSLQYALRVVKVSREIMSSQKEFILSKQFMRSGTSVGAMVREAEQAESLADFIHKLAIAQKEIHENDYWTVLLSEAGYLQPEEFNHLQSSNLELRRILAKIIMSSKARLKSQKGQKRKAS